MPRILLHLTLLITLLLSIALVTDATAPPAPTPPPQLAAAVAARQLDTLTRSPFPDISIDPSLSMSIPRAPADNTTLSVTPSGTGLSPQPTGAASGLWEGSSGAAVYCALVAVALVVAR